MIRKATIKDLDTLITIYKETLDNIRFSKSYIKKYIFTNFVYLKEVDNEIVGAYIFEINNIGNPYLINKIPYNVCWIHQLMVSNKHKNKGYGIELMNHFFKHGLESNVTAYRLVCTKELIKYHERFGYKVIYTGKKTKKDKEYYFTMEKMINQ